MSYGMIAIILILSYLAGSIPTSIIVGKILKGRNFDIRQHGSGNAGGTNVFRVLGWKPGLFVMSFDVFKGFVAAFWIAKIWDISLFENDPFAVSVFAGLAAILGHTYTVFAKFKGGKGVGTAGGMLIAIFPIGFSICLGVFFVVLTLSGYVSLSSIAASVAFPIVLKLLPPAGTEDSVIIWIIAVLIPFFIVFTHRSNVVRLFRGEENRFEKVMIFKPRG